MTRIDIKPLSVNQAWQGRRFKTPLYKQYERDLLLLLPGNIVVPDGELKLEVEVGFSSKASDLDNAIKPFQDVLQKKYGFDDKNIIHFVATKIIVPKGQEYIKFRIEEYGKAHGKAETDME